MPAAKERTDRKCSLVVPSPPGAGPSSHRGKAPTLTWRDLKGYIESGRLRLHKHSQQHIHSCSANQESSREKLYFLKLSEALARKTLCLLGWWSAQRTGPGLSGAVWGPHRDSFKRGTEARLSRDPVLACARSDSAKKETRMAAWFKPNESSCSGRTESGTLKELWDSS